LISDFDSERIRLVTSLSDGSQREEELVVGGEIQAWMDVLAQAGLEDGVERLDCTLKVDRLGTGLGRGGFRI